MGAAPAVTTVGLGTVWLEAADAVFDAAEGRRLADADEGFGVVGGGALGCAAGVAAAGGGGELVDFGFGAGGGIGEELGLGGFDSGFGAGGGAAGEALGLGVALGGAGAGGGGADGLDVASGGWLAAAGHGGQSLTGFGLPHQRFLYPAVP